jgi:hypothetical protein
VANPERCSEEHITWRSTVGSDLPKKAARHSGSRLFHGKDQFINAVWLNARGRRSVSRSVVSTVSATGPCEPTRGSTARASASRPTWCDVVSGQAPYCPVCRCNRDGMEEVRHSNSLGETGALSSTRHNASPGSPLRVLIDR